MPEPTRPSEETVRAEREEAEREHVADREPTPDEERRARGLKGDPEVSEHEREMTRRGAEQRGEGRLP